MDVDSIGRNVSRTVSSIEAYRHFSCATMHRQLIKRLRLQPYSETIYASVLLADISGFTLLSARLSAEELKQHINEYFTLLLNVVKENFGDVIKFLGDAVLIIWPVDKNVSEDVQSAATLMACLCALQLLKDCGTYDRGEGQNKVSLRLHCGIGAGLIHCMCMGEEERWEFLISGDPLNQVGLAESEAAIGEVCLSEIANFRIEKKLETKRMPKGSYKLTGRFLTGTSVNSSNYRSNIFEKDNSTNKLTSEGLFRGVGFSKKILETRNSLNSSNSSPLSNVMGSMNQHFFTRSTSQHIFPKRTSIPPLHHYKSNNNIYNDSTNSLDTNDEVVTVDDIHSIDVTKTTSSFSRINKQRTLSTTFEGPNEVNKYDDDDSVHKQMEITISKSPPKTHVKSNSVSEASPKKPEAAPAAAEGRPKSKRDRANTLDTLRDDSYSNITSDSIPAETAPANTPAPTATATDENTPEEQVVIQLKNESEEIDQLPDKEGETDVCPSSPTMLQRPLKSDSTRTLTEEEVIRKQQKFKLLNVHKPFLESITNFKPTSRDKNPIGSNTPPAVPTASVHSSSDANMTEIRQRTDLRSDISEIQKRSSMPSLTSSKSYSDTPRFSNTTRIPSIRISNKKSHSSLQNLQYNNNNSNSNWSSSRREFEDHSSSVSSNSTVATHWASIVNMSSASIGSATSLAGKEYYASHSQTMHHSSNSGTVPPTPAPTPSTTPTLPSSNFSHIIDNELANAVRAYLTGFLPADIPNDSGSASGVQPSLRHGGATCSLSRTSSSASPKETSPNASPLSPIAMSTVFNANDGSGTSCSFSTLEREVTQVLRYFVHDAARSAVESNLFGYLSELRNVVTLFIGLYGLEDDLNRGKVHRPQMAIAAILACMNRFGGSLRQYVVDDKGCVVIIAFGLPGSSHEDNCSRAVETAVAVRKNLQSIGVECKQGIAEGKVYCGLVGTADRCEYAMMGASVNLAARLMGSCLLGQVLVNDTVYAVARVTFVFKHLSPIKAKGYVELVPVFSPTERLQSIVSLGLTVVGDGSFVGRAQEYSLLSGALDKLEKVRGSGGLQAYLVEGEVGVGKTRLVAEVMRLAAEPTRRIKSIASFATTAHATTPYFVVRQLLENVLGLKLGRSLTSNIPSLSLTPTTSQRAEEKVATAAPSRGLDRNRHRQQSFVIRRPYSRGMSISNGLSAKHLVNSDSDENYDSTTYNSICSWLSQRARGALLDEHLLPIINETFLISTSNQTSPIDSIIINNPNYPHPSLSLMSKNLSRSSSPNSRDRMRKPLGRQLSTNSPGLFQPSRKDDFDGTDRIQNNYLVFDLVPLLGEIFNCRFKDTSVSSALKATRRKKMLLMESLVLRILLIGLEARRNLVVVDNLQWVDIYSLRIILRLSKALTTGVFVVTQRLNDNLHSAATVAAANIRNLEDSKRKKLTSAIIDGCTRIELQPLQAGDVKAIMERCIGAKLLTSHPEILSVENVREVMSRAGGSPFHAMVLAQGLRKALATGKFTRIEDLPAGAHNIIVARFDQLNSPDQAILKTASVIGLKFSEEELRYTLMKTGHEACAVILSQCLNRLLESNLIMYESKELTSHSMDDDCVYCFADRTVQESIADILLATQSEDIHNTIGLYLESLYTHNNPRIDDVIYHFIRSNNIVKKVEYLKLAADESQNKLEFLEAHLYYEQLIKLETGYNIEELFYYCYYKFDRNRIGFTVRRRRRKKRRSTDSHQSIERVKVRPSIASFVGFDNTLISNGISSSSHPVDSHSEISYHKSRQFMVFHHRWISYEDLIEKVRLTGEYTDSIAYENTFENICLWIGAMALTQIM